MTLYGIQLKAKYDSFDSYHFCVSKKLFKTHKEAEDYIPAYKEEIIKKASEKSQGFYSLDPDWPIETWIIDFVLDYEY